MTEKKELKVIEGGKDHGADTGKDLSPFMNLFQEILGLPTTVTLKYNQNGTTEIERGYPVDEEI